MAKYLARAVCLMHMALLPISAQSSKFFKLRSSEARTASSS